MRRGRATAPFCFSGNRKTVGAIHWPFTFAGLIARPCVFRSALCAVSPLFSPCWRWASSRLLPRAQQPRPSRRSRCRPQSQRRRPPGRRRGPGSIVAATCRRTRNGSLANWPMVCGMPSARTACRRARLRSGSGSTPVRYTKNRVSGAMPTFWNTWCSASRAIWPKARRSPPGSALVPPSAAIPMPRPARFQPPSSSTCRMPPRRNSTNRSSCCRA